MRARFVVGVMAVVAVVLVSALPAGANLPGAIFTTDGGCTGVNVNLFGAKADVFLDGGPKGASGSGLPDGSYFVKVTAPNGALLGQSAGATIHVTNGEFDECYSLFDLTSFADTPNAGGEYKVWISPDPTFPNSLSKTDNFKVLANPKLPVPTVSTQVIDDRTGAEITDQVASATEGDTFTVHDVATVSGTGPIPVGDVTFDLYANGVCDPTGGVLTSETVSLTGGTASSSSSVSVPLGEPAELEYSYQASYGGDEAHTATLAECEPFFVAIVAAEVTTPVVDPGVGATTELAFTGGGRAWLAALGFALVVAGGGLLALTRRRERVGVRL